MIPVTLLCGFLGAGKTTLLNRLLAAPHGERIAIVENEFGPVGIDSALIEPGAATVVELANGCICCSVRGELAAALADLLARRDKGEIAFDRLIIETTGLADPSPVVQTFFWEEALRERFLLDGVIAVIDACHATRQLASERVATAQIAIADWLLLSKTELADAEETAALRERLARINARAPIIDATEADWRALLATGGFNLDERGLPTQGWSSASSRTASPFGKAAPRSWDDDIASLLLESDAALDLDAISGFVEGLIAQHSPDLLRYKGILAIAGEPRRLIFQGVHKIAGFDYGRPWDADEPRTSRIVLIGRQLPAATLTEAFLGTRAS